MGRVSGRERIWGLGASCRGGGFRAAGRVGKKIFFPVFPEEMTFVCSGRQHKGNVCVCPEQGMEKIHSKSGAGVSPWLCHPWEPSLLMPGFGVTGFIPCCFLWIQ